MKPEMTADLVAELVEIIKSSKSFILEQAPSVIREIYAWNMWHNKILMIIGAIVVLLGVALTICSISMESYDAPIPLIFGIIFLTIGTVLSFCSYLDSRKMQIAPKLYLLDYLADMAKPKN